LVARRFFKRGEGRLVRAAKGASESSLIAIAALDRADRGGEGNYRAMKRKGSRKEGYAWRCENETLLVIHRYS